MENPPGTPHYVLGRSESESRRLIKQSSFLQPFTERIFRRAGLGPGMRVLDLGCGTGDVSFLAAEFVGPTGSVVGIDRDPGVLAIARQRALQMELKTVSFEEQSIEEFSTSKPFDAVVGRFVLVYQPDPVSTLGHLRGLLRAGGILVVLEPDMSVDVRSWPPVPLWQQVSDWIRETFRRGGVHFDIGARLYPLFRRAGWPGPDMRQDVLIGGGEAVRPLYEHCTEMVRSLLPRMDQFGIAKAEEVQVDTLAERLERETSAADSQLAYCPSSGPGPPRRRPEASVSGLAEAPGLEKGRRIGSGSSHLSSAHRPIVADPLDLVALRIRDVQRPPVDPGVLGGGDPQAEPLQPCPHGLVVGKVDLEGDVVNRGLGRVQAPVVGLPRSIEQGEDLVVAAVPLGDAEEGGVVEPPDQFQADHHLVERQHDVDVADPQGDLSEAPDRRPCTTHERHPPNRQDTLAVAAGG